MAWLSSHWNSHLFSKLSNINCNFEPPQDDLETLPHCAMQERSYYSEWTRPSISNFPGKSLRWELNMRICWTTSYSFYLMCLSCYLLVFSFYLVYLKNSVLLGWLHIKIYQVCSQYSLCLSSTGKWHALPNTNSYGDLGIGVYNDILHAKSASSSYFDQPLCNIFIVALRIIF